jgi:threonyl-tRNA synthetase
MVNAMNSELTAKNLEILRHSTAHLLAHAVKILHPDALLTIGPVVEDGFYYDFYFPNGFSEADFPAIEAKMKELSDANLEIIKHVWSKKEAIKFFTEKKEKYKVELIKELPEGEEISVYEQGDFIDLCRGPHVAKTGVLKAFKLTKVSGAYWRGDSKNEMLQRIYGTAWESQQELDAYLKKIEEAKLRDHRLLGKKLDLFHFEEIAPGMPFWHPRGWIIYQQIKKYLRSKLKQFGYQEVCTPQILDQSLWEKSGHWGKYSEVMFTVSSENRLYALKPMNCPGHIETFKQGLKSYHDLPIRFAEFTILHRNEVSGTLHGLLRVREFVQDDGHIFCTEDQISQEAKKFIAELIEVYADFGFKEIITKLATRPEKRIGEDTVWDKAEKALEMALNSANLKWDLNPGEGAFYGPKIEFSLKDSLGRVWQCGTLQVDFSMPNRLGAYYIDEDSSKKPPVALHRAMLGSLERFIGILLEDTAGNLPFWLSPVQVVVLNITNGQKEYVEDLVAELKKVGIRAISDLRNEKIGFKIREHSIQRIPYQVVVGDRELESKTVAVRSRSGEDLGKMEAKGLIELLLKNLERR